MAEALGIAASVIQIVDSAAKLRSLWRSIRDAPEDLSDSVQDIERTVKLLKKSQELFSRTNGIDDETITECSNDLERVLNALRAVLASLEGAVSRNRRLGAIKIVLKKDELVRGRQKLERAQKLLSAAQQNLYLAVQLSHRVLTQQSHAILVNIAGVLPQANRGSAVILPGTSTSSVEGQNDPPENNGRWPSGNHVQVSSQQPRRNDSAFCLRIPIWKRCYELACHHEMASLHLLFRTYNILDDKSSPYIAVQVGDVDALQSLFSAGVASPFDQDRNGNNLLLLALEYEQPAMAQFLLKQGGYPDLSPVSKRHYKLWPHLQPRNQNSWLYVHNFQERVCKIAQMVQLLTEQLDVDLAQWMGEASHSLRDEGLDYWPSICLEGISQAATLGIHTLPRDVRAALARNIPTLTEFQQLLGTDLSVHEILELSPRPQKDVPQMLGRITYECKVDDWSSIVREIFVFDKLQGSTHCWSNISLLGSFNYIRPLSIQEADDILQPWLRFLKDSGTDLMYYGRRESQAIANEGMTHYCLDRYISFNYGPEPEDWKLCCVQRGIEYELAGDFWDVVENPELFSVPGSFLDDHDEDDEWWMQEWLDAPIRRQAEKEKRRKVWEAAHRAESIVEVG